MLPNNILTTELEIAEEPNKTYKMNIEEKYISGICDGLEAVKQSVYKILNTERYKHIIYSWDYGVELSDLIGEPISYVCSELQRRITEALQQDDRITEVTDFEFNTDTKHEVVCAFVVHTIFGEIPEETVVEV